MGFLDTQDNPQIPFGDTTFSGKGGVPYSTAREAYLSQFSNASGQFTDSKTGKVYNSERAMQAARYDDEHK